MPILDSSRLGVALVLALSLTFVGTARAACDPDVQEGCDEPPQPEPAPLAVAVNRVVDMTDSFTLVQFASPLAVSGLARWSEGGTNGGVALRTTVARTGKRAGRVSILPMEAFLGFGGDLGDRLDPGFRAALLDVDTYYLCRDPGSGSFVFALPLLEMLPPGPLCRAGEWLGYTAGVAEAAWQPEFGAVGVRVARLGVVGNLLATGRTDAVDRNEISLRLGGAVDHSVFGSAPRPAAVGSNDTIVRGQVGFDLAGSTDDRRFRARLAGRWEPRAGFGDDHVLTADANVTLLFAPSPYDVLGLGLVGSLVHATRPWTALHSWMDRSQETSARFGLEFSYFWSVGR